MRLKEFELSALNGKITINMYELSCVHEVDSLKCDIILKNGKEYRVIYNYSKLVNEWNNLGVNE